MTRGVTIEVEGDANDYTGKGSAEDGSFSIHQRNQLFGRRRISLLETSGSTGQREERPIFRGCAAERFCVRNSGAKAVIEGVGDHGCEYMTGGRAVILGRAGRNFAAGMSGGVAYVFDPKNEFPPNCNRETIELEELLEDDLIELRILIENHRGYTGSVVASGILEEWDKAASQFVKVMPVDYKRALREFAEEEGKKRRSQRSRTGGDPRRGRLSRGWASRQDLRSMSERHSPNAIRILVLGIGASSSIISRKRNYVIRRAVHGLRSPLLPHRRPHGEHGLGVPY